MLAVEEHYLGLLDGIQEGRRGTVSDGRIEGDGLLEMPSDDAYMMEEERDVLQDHANSLDAQSTELVSGGPCQGGVRGPIDGDSLRESVEVLGQRSEPSLAPVIVPHDDATISDHPDHLLRVVLDILAGVGA